MLQELALFVPVGWFRSVVKSELLHFTAIAVCKTIMAAVTSFNFSEGIVEKAGPSKAGWSPGDPLPWTASVSGGVPCNADMTYKRLRTLQNPEEFEVRSDDVYCVTYPKSGTTWTLQIIKCLVAKGEPETLTGTLDDLFPWVEAVPDLSKTISMPSPRVLKSHATYSMVPKVKEGQPPCKYVHVMRHPKDTCVSLYFHMLAFKVFEYDGPFSEFFDLFIHGMVDLGSWFEYEKAWWEHRNDPNVLLLKYEDMHTSPAECIERIAKFIGLDLGPDIIQKAVEKSRFKVMKDDTSANGGWKSCVRHEGSKPFLRKGIVGDWKSHFSEEQSKEFDRVFHEKLDGTGLEDEWVL